MKCVSVPLHSARPPAPTRRLGVVPPVKNGPALGGYGVVPPVKNGPALGGYGVVPPIKNGPALGGYGAVAMKDASPRR
jgi:hypothetical protein